MAKKVSHFINEVLGGKFHKKPSECLKCSNHAGLRGNVEFTMVGEDDSQLNTIIATG